MCTLVVNNWAIARTGVCAVAERADASPRAGHARIASQQSGLRA